MTHPTTDPMIMPIRTAQDVLHYFPKRGWKIEIYPPLNALNPDEPEPVLFRGDHLGGDWDSCEGLSFEAAVYWLATKLRWSPPEAVRQWMQAYRGQNG